MNSYPSKKQKTVVILGIGLLVIGLAVAAIWVVSRGNSGDEAASQSEGAPSSDTIRKQHAATLANRLFSNVLVQRQPIPEGQAGLDKIATDIDGNIVKDPTTNEPYVFASDQSTMEVGEAHFRIGASCDNKTAGSDGKGMIVDYIDNSVAVAIKLESGGFACESSL